MNMLSLYSFVVLVLAVRLQAVLPFQPPSSVWRQPFSVGHKRTHLMMTTAATPSQSTLTEETTWKFQLVLRGMPTEKGKLMDDIFTLNCQFVEDVNYEPPQGSLCQIVKNDEDDDGANEKDKERLKIVASRWKLSEDPNERKDGLWVWGLFEEPLYPFLLLQFTTDRIPLPGEDGDAIKPMTLFAQINHKREKGIGAILERAELKIRRTETVNADIFGVSTADLVEEASVGTLVVEPIS